MQLPTRRRVLAVLAVLAATIAAIAPATPANAAPPAADATASALLDAFATHQIVALGQVHDLRQEDDFILDLLRHPRFAATVDSIVVEFGNARYQSRVDRYIAGRPRRRRALLPRRAPPQPHPPAPRSPPRAPRRPGSRLEQGAARRPGLPCRRPPRRRVRLGRRARGAGRAPRPLALRVRPLPAQWTGRPRDRQRARASRARRPRPGLDRAALRRRTEAAGRLRAPLHHPAPLGRAPAAHRRARRPARQPVPAAPTHPRPRPRARRPRRRADLIRPLHAAALREALTRT